MNVAITAALVSVRLVLALGFLPIAVAEDRIPTDDVEPAPESVKIILTAYSSSPDETDDTPFVTASGTITRDGVIANNCLPFGTEVRIPEIFGDKIFVVEDRKHPRYSCEWFDVWYPSKSEAKSFGINRDVEALVF
ncbi:MAG TPA: hypothetical protein VNK70_00475 [Candidatus Paceibacterota bacterium]|nr:hypothetical protein [Candidatus Paceibacterota bacterium]